MVVISARPHSARPHRTPAQSRPHAIAVESFVACVLPCSRRHTTRVDQLIGTIAVLNAINAEFRTGVFGLCDQFP
jgi:hypothetical protein